MNTKLKHDLIRLVRQAQLRHVNECPTCSRAKKRHAARLCKTYDAMTVDIWHMRKL